MDRILKDRQRDSIARDTEVYLRGGGRIEQLGVEATGIDTLSGRPKGQADNSGYFVLNSRNEGVVNGNV